MTDKPTTLSLDSTEWRGLLSQNLVRANEFVTSQAVISPQHVKALHDHMDRMKALVTAWQLSQPPVPAPTAQAGQAAAPAAPQTNGAAPKKTGGWPKGRKRKQPLAPQAAH